MVTALLRSLVVLGTLAATAPADDAYFRLPLSHLKFTDGNPAPVAPRFDWRHWQQAFAMAPYAVLDGPGEVFLQPADQNASFSARMELDRQDMFVRTSQQGEVTGRLFYPKSDWSGLSVRKFVLPALSANPEARAAFYRAKEQHYSRLWGRDIPGAAWFRHQSRLVAKEAGIQDATTAPRATFQPRSFNRLEDTYALFSGGRAVSENLQLDRVLREVGKEQATVDIATLEGITVAEIDWRSQVKDLKPALDPLAKFIPADQHVVFFRTFNAAVRTADEADRQGTLVLQLAAPRSESARTIDRYQRQLGLSLTGLGRLLGPQVAASVALTGSDPYYRVGTDIAVLFETPKSVILEGLLLTQINLAATQNPLAKPEQGKVDGVAYQGIRSPDRTICSYVARLDGAVVVTNSLYQLGRLASVANKQSPAVASLDEYVFFRERYQLDDPDESAFIFLSDATIRRWCGPRWRIATSRRTRDMAVLAELQAVNLDRLAKKRATAGPIYTDLPTADVGELSLNEAGVRSSVQGSLEFMTPIAEQELLKVTKAEADAYHRWRDSYQRNWRWAFDPIALRITRQTDRLGADLSVMPLIFNSEYREILAISEGAAIAPTAGDPHDALLHVILAINTKSPTIQRSENFISTMSQGITLGWLGQSVAFYLDDDPVWMELAKIPPDDLDKAMPAYIGRLPIAIRAEVTDGLRLTAFLAALRAFIEQTAPGMVQWESLTYKDQPYVKISPSERAKGQQKELEKLNIFYVASGDALVASLSEKLVKRAIDRQLARSAKSTGAKSESPAAETPAAKAPATEKLWLGNSVGLRVERKAIDILRQLTHSQYQIAMQLRAWGNLPILNEWKRLYPDQDPVELHERIWKIRLICPGGGRYVWNEQYQTMESSVYGHPGEPKIGSATPAALDQFSFGAFGLTFEKQGLRARVSLEHAPAAETKSTAP